MRYGARAELTRQLHLLACTLVVAGDRQNLILHWLAHTRLKSEVTPSEVSCRTLQLDQRTQTLFTLENEDVLSGLRTHVSGPALRLVYLGQ